MPKVKEKKKIPIFKNDDQKRDCCANQDSSDYIDWRQGKRVIFSKLKPSTKTISLRLPEAMLENLKLLANKRDIPYQSLLKVFLAERMEKEFNH
jgi:predicted DNA binding CopG/RHH family protein